jgi:tellurite resistance protein TehA-like permease
VLNVVIFLSALSLYTTRWLVAPRATAALVLHDHNETPYLAAGVIAYLTVVAMIGLVCAESWGHGWAIFAYVLWWIGAVMSTLVSVALPWIMWVLDFFNQPGRD